jgi:hypothetical protein
MKQSFTKRAAGAVLASLAMVVFTSTGVTRSSAFAWPMKLSDPPCVGGGGAAEGAGGGDESIPAAGCAPSKTECDDKYQDCVNNGPTSCLEREGGKTLCQRCWERCNAGDSASSKYRNCKF